MFSYEPNWSSSAVRRFIAKIADGPDALDELFALREADNVGSGLPADAGRLGELRARVRDALREGVVLERRDLAVDGDDLMAELGLEPGPRLGRILDGLLERVVERSGAQRPAEPAAARPGDARGGAMIEIAAPGRAQRSRWAGSMPPRQLYRQVADADPRNSIAVVGLARVTLERGDEAGALELARQALAIDPENAAAGRMVERLDEVIRYRGGEPPAAVTRDPRRRPGRPRPLPRNRT